MSAARRVDDYVEINVGRCCTDMDKMKQLLFENEIDEGIIARFLIMEKEFNEVKSKWKGIAFFWKVVLSIIGGVTAFVGMMAAVGGFRIVFK